MAEVEYLILLSRDLTYLTPEQVEPLQQEVSEISRMLYALRERSTDPAPGLELPAVGYQLSAQSSARESVARVPSV